jgi:hypothetical protein
MTLNDIGRMIEMMRIPQSKCVEVLFPDPRMQIDVPGSHYLAVVQVVAQMTLPGQKIEVGVLTSREVKPGEHVYFKVRGATAPASTPYDDPFMPPDEQRRHRAKTARRRNAEVVIEMAVVRM